MVTPGQTDKRESEQLLIYKLQQNPLVWNRNMTSSGQTGKMIYSPPILGNG